MRFGRLLWASIPMVVLLLTTAGLGHRLHADLLTFPEKPVDRQLAAFKKWVDKTHKKTMKITKPWREEDLRKQVPRKYLALEKRYAKIKNPSQRALALAQLALIYTELAWVKRIRAIRKKLVTLDTDLAERLGQFEESDHFFVRVVGTDPKWGKSALKLGEAARAGYLKVFGFRTISKVPGKKIRVLIHVDPSLKTRLYFHPTPLYLS